MADTPSPRLKGFLFQGLLRHQLKRNVFGGAPVRLSRLTLDFGLGHDLVVRELEPSGSVLTAESLLGVLSPSPSLSAPSPLTLSLSK